MTWPTFERVGLLASGNLAADIPGPIAPSVKIFSDLVLLFSVKRGPIVAQQTNQPRVT
jgi:hypothetical protein